MRIPLNWLRDYVEIPGDVDALMDMGRTLLAGSADFQRLLRDLGPP